MQLLESCASVLSCVSVSYKTALSDCSDTISPDQSSNAIVAR